MRLLERQDPRYGLELVKCVVLIAAPKGSFGEEIHSEQNAQQKRQKGQRKFPK